MQRILIITLWKSRILAASGYCMGTRAAFYKQLCWSLFWLYLGIEPTQNSNEEDIAGGGGWLADGWRGCIWALLQDLEALAEELELKGPSEVEPCNWCGASSGSPRAVSGYASMARWKSMAFALSSCDPSCGAGRSHDGCAGGAGC